MFNFIQLGEKVLNLNDWRIEIKKSPTITKLVSPNRVVRVPQGDNKELFIFNNWKKNISF